MADVTQEQVIDYISNMSVLELSEMVKVLEEKFGVSAAAAVAAAPAGGGAAAEAPKEQTEFAAVLTSFGEKKISVIKEIRAITGLGLKEAKAFVEGVPKTVKEGIEKADAEAIQAKLEAAGATVEIK